MNYLLFSILLNAYLGVVFVLFNKYKIDLFQAIVYNYITCVVTGIVVSGHSPLHANTLNVEWFKWALLMGSLFITVFNIIAFSSVKAGVTVTQTANKLSLIIPVLFAWYYYRESIGIIKWGGILLALVSVIFTIWKTEKSAKQKSLLAIVLPVVLFVSSGIIDTLTKYVENHFIKNDKTANDYLITGFFVAAFLGFLLLILLYIFNKKTFHSKHLVAGVVLGVPNYFSIFYLIKALRNNDMSSSAVIPINNIGVLLVVSIVGIFIFKEKMSKLNYIGILLAVISILLIYIGDKN